MSEDHIEIERAWVLEEMPAQELITHSIPHQIAYLFSESYGELRIVKRYHEVARGMPSDCEKFSITVKSGQSGLSRNEWEDDELPEWAFLVLEAQGKHVVEKTRYFVNHNEHKLEINQYANRSYSPYADLYTFRNVVWTDDINGKIRLECEFSSEEEAKSFELPEWAEGAMEITGILDYRNRMIAQYGWPSKEKE